MQIPLEDRRMQLIVLPRWPSSGPIVHHFTRSSCIALAADQTTCLQLVGRNLVRRATEMKNSVERGLPLPSIWPIHLTDCY